MFSENHLEDEDYGFGPAKPVRQRPRLRLGLTIAVTVLGILFAAATVVAFVLARDFAIKELPERGIPTAQSSIVEAVSSSFPS